jgi:dihydrofolate reductase
MIALIAASAGEKRVIGKDGDLPWHYSCDLKFFKDTTMGHTVLMGRVSYQSILKRLGKPLPGRRTVVLTRDKNFQDDRVQVIHDLKKIPELVSGGEKLFITGGGDVFAQVLNIADTVYLTQIDKEIEGDTFFPPLDPAKWRKIEERVETENNTTLRFQTYNRTA